MLDRGAAERGEQFLVAGGIGGSQIIDRFHQPHPKEVGPHPVDDRPREVGILRRRQPTGERFATVTGGVQGQRRAVERRRRLRPAGLWLQQVAPGFDEQRPLAVAASGFAPPALRADPREKVGEGVILVVCPFLERMVVALRAIDRERHEGLAHILGHRLRILMDGEEVGGAVLETRPLGRDHVPHEAVPGRVLRHAVAYPLVVRIDRLGPQLRSTDEQHVGPLVGPVVDELGPRKQQVDESLPLPWGGIDQVAVNLVRRRQPADGVEKGTPQERRVVTRGRGLEVKLLELLEHEIVDEVRPSRTGEHVGRNLVGKGHQHASQRDL